MRICRFPAGMMLLLAVTMTYALVVGSVRGVVHDPQHRPLAGAMVTLAAHGSDFKLDATTNNSGEFAFAAVPAGQYSVMVTFDSFHPVTQTVAVTSTDAPVLHIQLAIATKDQTVTVSDTSDEVQTQPTETVVSRSDIARTPGATRTNSLAMITDQVPGAYIVHDQLHLRGGHQVSWLIDGIPVPNTNIASNVGPQFDPKDIDSLEVQRGDYSAEYGDRAYGVFNAVTRSGFERNREGEVVLSYGSFHQTNSQINFGDHTQTFAWYASVSGNRTEVGLETPTTAILHDQNNGQSAFLSLIWNRKSSDQFRIVASARNDFYQVPNDPAQQSLGVTDVEREHDTFVNAAWVHTSSPNVVFTVAPFYHMNHAAYDGSAADDPLIPTQDRTSQYAGLVAMATVAQTKNNLRLGTQMLGEHDDALFGVTCSASGQASGVCGANAISDRVTPSGGMEAAFVEDQYKPFAWLEINGGLRFTHFSGDLSESAADPRVGAKLTLPKLHWTLHGFYGRYYQPPPLATVGGPILDLASQQRFGFLPLKGERDEQREFGLSIPLRHWLFDITNFQTHAKNFFDHDVLGNSNIFFPLTIDRARIHGTEVTIHSPRLWNRVQWHLAFSRQWAEGAGGVTGGLTDFSPPGSGYFFLDHDQRTTIATGANVDLPWRMWISANLSYGSGFLDGDGPQHLGSNNTVDVALSKSIGERWTLGFTAVNLADHRFLIDNSNTFGGTHWSEPRQVIGEVRYRFRF
jgi:outer membrane receptor for ferrienterochelin and colicin